jgi:hypothetical protein
MAIARFPRRSSRLLIGTTLVALLVVHMAHPRAAAAQSGLRQAEAVEAALRSVLDAPVTRNCQVEPCVVTARRGEGGSGLRPPGAEYFDVRVEVLPDATTAVAGLDRMRGRGMTPDFPEQAPVPDEPIGVGANAAAYISGLYEHGGVVAAFACGNLYTSVIRAEGVPRQLAAVTSASESLAAQKEQIARHLKAVEASKAVVRAFVPALAQAFQEKGACRPAIEQVSCTAPAAIATAQIDAYLDYLAAQLQFAVEKAETYAVHPIGTAARRDRFSYKDAADLGRAIWDQAHGLQRAHVERAVTLNEQQKRRTKAFGHWADWLQRRAVGESAPPSPGPVGPVVPGQPQPVPAPAPPPSPGMFTPPPQPPYPLRGAIDMDVPTPPQLKGEDVLTVNIPFWGPEAITDDYAWAGLQTIAQGADMWYTRGMFWTAYLAFKHQSMAPVAMGALQRIPYFGPTFSATLVSLVELNSVTDIGALRSLFGDTPLTWDQHLANMASLTNMTLGAAVRTFPSLNRVGRRVGGIDPGTIGPDVEAKFGAGKSFRVLSQRKDPLGNDVADIEYALVGPLKDNPGNKVSFLTGTFRVVNGRHFTVKPTGETDQPVFFLGQPGYHEWKHLTEINAGWATKFQDEALLQVFAGRKDYMGRLLAIKQAMMDPTRPLDEASNLYIDFTNQLIADAGFTRVTGFYRWKNRDGSLAPAEANIVPMIPKQCTPGGPTTTYPVRISIDPTNGRLKGLFVLKPDDPSAAFSLEKRVPVVESLFRAWARDLNDHLYSFSPFTAYLPEK